MMRRDPEAIAAYRRMLAESTSFKGDVDSMSDELVVETIERIVGGIVEAGRAVARAFESLRPVVIRMSEAITDAYASVGGAVLAHETELDLQMRDELDVDVRLLELFDPEH